MKSRLVFIFLLLGQQAWAAPQIEAHDSSYGIMGSTPRQLRDQMNLFRVQEAHGSYDADTQWNIKWNYQYLKTANICTLSNYQVHLDIIYHLPQWLNPETAESPLREHWGNYMEHLRIHENGHARNSEKAAWEIEAMLNEIAPMSSCKLLAQIINERAHQILAEHNAWDVEYDRETGHGKTQGAAFP